MSLIPRLFILLALSCALMACAAPSTTPAAIDEAAVSAPPMSSPLPPRLAKETVAIDTTCKTSADCAVKNVGNCCGAMPACVNKDSPTDPAAVQAQCNAKGMMGVCGFKEISACQCDNGQCTSADTTTMKTP